VAGGGKKKYYASAVMTGELTIDDITKIMEKTSTVSGTDIRAVLYGAERIMIDGLGDGKIVRMGELGTFRASISSKGHDTPEEVTADSITDIRVIFSVEKKIKKIIRAFKCLRARR